MKLILLGTTGYHPNDQRHTACFMIPELGIILDAGTAMYRARKFLRTPELDVFLTHAHLDHVIGLTFLLDVLQNKNVRRVTVHGAPDKLAAVKEHLFAELLFPVKPPFEFRPLAPRVPLASGGTLTHFPLQHPGGTLGYRLDWPGHSLAYVTDTTATNNAAYLNAIAGVDVLLHECNFPDTMAEMAALTGHSVTTPVAELARNAQVGRLVLVHVDPAAEEEDPLNLEAARAIFPRTVLGYDWMEVDF
ncbi:MAG: MBL fold metallo-hydrolase [Planctomycetia bacterium]|nr:MBL fold metallo-hydrolase [Planctomycetia bacterium]